VDIAWDLSIIKYIKIGMHGGPFFRGGSMCTMVDGYDFGPPEDSSREWRQAR